MSFQSTAIEEIESILEQSGWASGISVTTQKQIEDATSPIFYRTATPAPAMFARISKGAPAQSAMLYMVYGSTGSQNLPSDNRTQMQIQRFAVSIYYDEPSLLDDGENKPFAEYLSSILEKLEDNAWSYTDGGEIAIQVTGFGKPYCYRKSLLVEKLF